MRAAIAQLQSENERLREWYQTALLLQSENQSLQALLNLKTEPQHRFVTTRVVADSGSERHDVLREGRDAERHL